MPINDAPRIVAGKAQHAAALVQRYNQVRNEAEKVQTVEQLNTLFPHIRMKHHPKEGLTVYYRADLVTRVPTALRFVASLILEVQLDGRAKVVKDKLGKVGRYIKAAELLVELGGEIKRKSRWDTIGSDEDWI